MLELLHEFFIKTITTAHCQRSSCPGFRRRSRCRPDDPKSEFPRGTVAACGLSRVRIEQVQSGDKVRDHYQRTRSSLFPERAGKPWPGVVMGNEFPTNGNGAAIQQPRAFIPEGPLAPPPLEEIKTCRSIASRCAFILGPARSGTTILAQIINANDRAYLTTEANFYEAGPHPDFRDWYNGQHLLFQNQIAKFSYALILTIPANTNGGSGCARPNIMMWSATKWPLQTIM